MIPPNAVPVPVPTPVAVNIVPTVLDAAPINVKLVVPTVNILYTLPITNNPAVSVKLPNIVSLNTTVLPTDIPLVVVHVIEFVLLFVCVTRVTCPRTSLLPLWYTIGSVHGVPLPASITTSIEPEAVINSNVGPATPPVLVSDIVICCVATLTVLT